MNEEWRDVVGYDGIYQVSNLGNVKTLSWHQTGRERLLIQHVSRKGYARVGLCKDGMQKTIYVHRLVCEAFIDNPNGYKEINHKDENKLNNRSENLEWCSRIYNVNYGSIKQKMHDKLINNPKRSRKIGQYDLNGNLIGVFDSVHDAERKLGFRNGNISQCCCGRYKQIYGYIWRHI